MDFELSEAQIVVQQSVRRFLSQRFPPGALQALAVGDAVPNVWPGMAELGWAGLLVPERYGGSGGGMLDAALILEELGYGCVPSPYIHSAVVASSIIAELGSEAQCERWLTSLASGARIMTLAVTEDSGEFSPETIRASGRPGVPLQGGKLFVKDADLCDDLIVVVRDAGYVNLLVVPRAACRLEAMETLSGERLFSVSLDTVTVDESRQLGSNETAALGLAHGLQRGALARSAEMVGLAQRVLDICMEHIKVREQSGQPIGAFQALQHSSADMLRNIEGARGIVLGAAWALEDDRTVSGVAARTATAMAKAYASEACLDVARRGHQVMGAIGYCEEHPLHILHKRIHAAALDFGDAADHLDQVADALGLTVPP